MINITETHELRNSKHQPQARMIHQCVRRAKSAGNNLRARRTE
jgi:hypothetical protein